MRRVVAPLAGSILVLVLTVSATPAFAGANPNASCLGIGGSTETALEGPGGRADIAHEVIDVAAPEAGTTPGGVYRTFAREHLEPATLASDRPTYTSSSMAFDRATRRP